MLKPTRFPYQTGKHPRTAVLSSVGRGREIFSQQNGGIVSGHNVELANVHPPVVPSNWSGTKLDAADPFDADFNSQSPFQIVGSPSGACYIDR
jgi:hypothetical protein